MMRRPLRMLSAVVFFSDLVCVSVAYLLRFHFEIVPPTKGFAPLGVYLSFLPVALALWVFASSSVG